MSKLKWGVVMALVFFEIAGCSVNLAQKYVDVHPELDAKTKHYILLGKVFIGMTNEQVFAALGPPLDINRSVGSWGVHEQWVYGPYYGEGPRKYYYFENGILTSWQD
jgi:hypothetical protein